MIKTPLFMIAIILFMTASSVSFAYVDMRTIYEKREFKVEKNSIAEKVNIQPEETGSIITIDIEKLVNENIEMGR